MFRKQLTTMIVCLYAMTPIYGDGTSGENSKENDLEAYFEGNPGRLIHKWMHYFEVYDHHFSRFRGKEVKVLEIGVFHGGSLQMWKKYFGEQAQIIGVDINPACKELEEERIRIYIGSQEEREFLAKLKAEIGRVDIVIDDGGHYMSQQITTFEELYPFVASNGIYLIEDLHTSYWPHFGGGYQRNGTFIEYSKNLIDQLNAWHSQDSENFQVDDFTKTTKSMHFYDSITVFEKGSISPPSHRMTGTPSF
jgi:23S rRNA U2552 (ribose-2'-O)-methylase RlmE/FtsJ